MLNDFPFNNIITIDVFIFNLMNKSAQSSAFYRHFTSKRLYVSQKMDLKLSYS